MITTLGKAIDILKQNKTCSLGPDYLIINTFISEKGSLGNLLDLSLGFRLLLLLNILDYQKLKLTLKNFVLKMGCVQNVDF